MNPIRSLLLPLFASSALLVCAPLPAAEPMGTDNSMPMDHHMMPMDHHQHMAAMMHAPVVHSTGTYQVPDVTFTNTDGKTVALRNLISDDEPLMLNFIYTSCTSVCPAMSGVFSQVQERLGKSVHLVSISIDPEYDTPARLKAYGKRFEAGPQWTLLTGSLQDSISVQRAFATYNGDKMEHTATTFIRAKADQPWLRVDGLASADDLVQEFHHLVAR